METVYIFLVTFIFVTMSIIDRIIEDIEKQVACYSDWHVEISTSAKKDKTIKEIYSWNAKSYTAAKAIKDYLIAREMTDGTLSEPQGSFIRIVKRKP